MKTADIYAKDYAIPLLPMHWFVFKDERFKVKSTTPFPLIHSLEVNTGYGKFTAYSIDQLRAFIDG